MFEPEGSVRPIARISYVTAALLVGAILVGGVVGAAVALVLYLPGVLATDGARGLVSFGLLMGAASGAGIGAIGGTGAVAGMVAVRVTSHRDGAFILGTSAGTGIGVLVASANLLVSRDAPTWATVLLTTAAASALCVWGSWLLTRHEHSWERLHAR
ncbi:hypothetical protein [Rathayibacter tanaceti]|uniref:Uncharacterized protein n=2 Tax=Rathayibacter tanaceti TaxID=1671680 RepID=A0A166HWB3_9MICO|nr:hypothetical protein [Rathayibacter tanaceti]KZX21256.1 hypothetical protein ACH61_01625 [Rathayibacter tanaceti]QHC54437.1 hypothetical protein GSU10_01340 [Rathayibacter tanaceti]TCO35080.1 hypothetical protein EV639_10984 [Rathayibacter tanaceti]